MSEFWLVVLGAGIANGAFVIGWLLCDLKWQKAFPTDD